MKNLVCIFFVLFFSSCSTQLKYEMNNVKFLTPETKGKLFKGDVGLGLLQTHKVVLTEALDALIFSSTTTRDVNNVENGSDLDLLFNFGILDRLDFYTVGGKLGLKYQFLGGTQLEKTDDYKLALAIAYGNESPDSESVVYTNNNSARTYSTEVKVESEEVALIFGRRTTPVHLYYTTLFYDRYEYDGKLSSNQFATINAKGKSSNWGMLIGYEASNSSRPTLSWKIETGVVEGKLHSHSKKTSGVFGSSLSIGW